MVTHKASSVGAGIALGLLALVVVMVLLASSAAGSAVAMARSDGSIIRVATTGSDNPGCGSAASPCRTVQYAVDLALAGDEIRVAEGTYTDVHKRADITQVVYISLPLTIRGGYEPPNWNVSNPAANPTLLDAGRQGRVVYVAKDVAPVTLENLSLTGGNTQAAGPSEDVGGGVFIRSNATATLGMCRIFDNTAKWGAGLGTDTGSNVTLDSSDVFSNTAFWGGGGLQLYESTAALTGCLVFSNTASNDEGGGLYVTRSTATLESSQVLSNTAARSGGGLHVLSGTLTLIGNTIASNHATIHGGGMNMSQGTATLTGNTISNNTGDYGGGVNMERSVATLTDNHVFSNVGTRGGGLFVYSGTVTVTANQISTNTATFWAGGGVYLNESPATLSANEVFSNTAVGYGGGLYLENSAATLIGNDIFRNIGQNGGGLGLSGSPASLINNLISANIATNGLGGGLRLDGSDALFVNTVLVDNRASSTGSGLFVTNNSSARLLHTTLTRNVGAGGVGIFCCDGGAGFGSVAMTNTILVSQTVGVYMAAGCSATLEATLWGSGIWANGQDLLAQGTIVSGTHNYWGNPGFVDYAAGDYHISVGSDAQDKGVDAGVTTDRDGRPRIPPPDLGAYEWQGFRVYLPVTLRGFGAP
jgi:hypothetical protein